LLAALWETVGEGVSMEYRSAVKLWRMRSADCQYCIVPRKLSGDVQDDEQ